MGNSIYERAMHKEGSMKDSVDALREGVKELYALDEDNYQMIKVLQKGLDNANAKIDRSYKHIGRIGRLVGFGLLLLGVGHVALNKVVEKHEAKINSLEQKISILMNPEGKAEESDG